MAHMSSKTNPRPTPENKMDPANKKIMRVWAHKGVKAAVSAMFKHPETKKPLSYSEMRAYYG